MGNTETLHTTKYEGVYYKTLKNTIGKTPDLSYYIIYRTNGKQKKKSVGKKSQRMTAAKANQIRNDILYEIKHGLNEHSQKELTFGYLKNLWFEDKKLKLKSIKEDIQRLDNYCSHLFDRKLMSISSKDIKEIYVKMINKGLSEQTFKKTYSMIKRVINHALEYDYIKTAPIIKLNLSIKDKKTTEVYTEEMIKKYVYVIDSYEDKIISKIVKLIFCTGMRRAEPLKIKWEHYSKENSTIKIEDAKSGDDEIYYLSNNAIEIIESQKGLTSEYIFEERPGQPIGTSRLSYHANKMKLKAGLPDNYRPLHSLRHNFGTQLARHGLNAFKIQKMMTHKNIKTTQRYIDLSDKEIVDDLNMIDKKLTIN